MRYGKICAVNRIYQPSSSLSLCSSKSWFVFFFNEDDTLTVKEALRSRFVAPGAATAGLMHIAEAVPPTGLLAPSDKGTATVYFSPSEKKSILSIYRTFGTIRRYFFFQL